MSQEQVINKKLPKSEKLKNQKSISLLFEKGEWVSSYPLKVKTMEVETGDHKVGFSVSKRFFKKAVDRNRIKRLLREAYRHNKDLYMKAFGSKSFTMFFYSSNEKPKSFHQVEEYFIKLCNKVIDKSSNLPLN